jgi:hypothetical protein
VRETRLPGLIGGISILGTFSETSPAIKRILGKEGGEAGRPLAYCCVLTSRGVTGPTTITKPPGKVRQSTRSMNLPS